MCKQAVLEDKCITGINYEASVGAAPNRATPSGVKFITGFTAKDYSTQVEFLPTTSSATSYDMEKGCLTGFAGVKETSDEFPTKLSFIYDPEIRFAEIKDMKSYAQMPFWAFIVAGASLFVCFCCISYCLGCHLKDEETTRRRVYEVEVYPHENEPKGDVQRQRT